MTRLQPVAKDLGVSLSGDTPSEPSDRLQLLLQLLWDRLLTREEPDVHRTALADVLEELAAAPGEVAACIRYAVPIEADEAAAVANLGRSRFRALVQDELGRTASSANPALTDEEATARLIRETLASVNEFAATADSLDDPDNDVEVSYSMLLEFEDWLDEMLISDATDEAIGLEALERLSIAARRSPSLSELLDLTVFLSAQLEDAAPRLGAEARALLERRRSRRMSA